MEVPVSEKVLVGLNSLDDAGVYLLDEQTALIQSLDFFTPIVNDPYIFGQVAAANAFSDIYAMGGTPITALNIVCFPITKMDKKILRNILEGGVEKIREAGAVLIGGHSLKDTEVKYGLAVSGTARPDRILTNSGARPGDRLILTKPLGTGIIGTALQQKKASTRAVEKMMEVMTSLNKAASSCMQQVGVNSCTDITGFGLLGHCTEMMEGSKVGLTIDASTVPLITEVDRYAKEGFIPGGTKSNREFYSRVVEFKSTVPEVLRDILFDAQTSGGLLISVSGGKANRLLKDLHQHGVPEAVIIGKVTDEKGSIQVR